MKKIGVLTYFKEFANHGTNMQSYCTFKAIQNAFPEAQVELVNYSSWKPVKKPYFHHMSISTLLKDFKRISKYSSFFKTNLVFGKKKLISNNLKKSIAFIDEQGYDAIFVGADTLLELKRAHKDELTAYWLDPTIKCKKFMIAASSHNVTYEGLTENQKKKIQETVDDYTLLGIRDEPTFRLLSHFTKDKDQRLQLLPDPTFTFQIDYSFIEKYLVSEKITFTKPLVCLHLVKNTSWAKDLSNMFRKQGYLIVSFRPARYADLILSDLSAFEQAGIYKYFSLIITHRFHDSIFSIKNLTPVIFYPEFETDVTIFNESKTLTLFKAFGIAQNNYIADRNTLNAQSLFKIHKTAIDDFNLRKNHIQNILNEYRERYTSYVQLTSKYITSN